MFKNKGELAAAMVEGREFNTSGWILRFDPKYSPPFVGKAPTSNDWEPMDLLWDDYAKVKEILPDLQALRSCVSNYLLGKAWLTDGVVDEILAMDSDSFWIMGSGKKLTLGFSPGKRLGMRFGDFHIKKHGDSYLAFK